MDYIRYANQNATRNQPLSSDLVSALGFLPDLGVQAEVFSGGQPVKGSGQPRVGSVRHDAGGAADVFFYKDGRRLDWANPEDQPIFSEIVSRGRERGLTGFGAGPDYMQPGSMHIGFGAPAVWGAGGKGANAPDWLRQAYSGAEAPQGGNMQRQPQGLLGTPTVSTRGQVPAQEEERKPFFQRPGVANAFDTLAMGLEGMTLNPNQGLIRGAEDRIQQRREMGQMEQQRNRTADWLESQGMTDLAGGVRSGALGARDALTMARGAEATSKQRDYQYLLQQGVDPQAAMERVFGGGGTTVNVGDQGPQIGTIPQGYQVAQDTETGAYRMEPIPGGPVDQERQADVEREREIEQQRGTKESVVSRDVDRLIGMIDKGGIFDLPEAGIVGSALADLGINQEAVTFRNTLSGIQAQVGFDRLQQMREASKTGGALGSVSEGELDLLISALGAIQQNTDPQTIKENLTFIRDTMTKIENDPTASRFYYGDGRSQEAPSAGQRDGGFGVTGRID